MSYKPEVMVDGRWERNALVFATLREAQESAHDLFMRWMTPTHHRAVESSDPVNATYIDHELKIIA